MKPTPICSTQRATCSGVRPRLMPACSIRSALPLLEETARLPCLATKPPAAATTKAEAEDTLNRLAPSPPVPTMSTKGSALMATPETNSRMTSTAPVISSTVSLLRRRPMSRAPIWASVASPFMTMRITLFISSRDMSRFSATRLSASFMFIGFAFLLGSQEVAEQFVALFAHDGFRVELHPLDGQCFVAHDHDLFHAAVAVASPGCHFQTFREAGLLNGQAVVASRLQRVVEAAEYASAVVKHRGYFAVHDTPGADNFTAEYLPNGLVPEADAENGNLAGKVADGLHGNPRFIWCAGAWRDYQPLRVKCFDLLHGDFVIAVHLYIGAQFRKILHHVVGEGIVVVDH